jgi:hypothetical protein
MEPGLSHRTFQAISDYFYISNKTTDCKNGVSIFMVKEAI